MIESKKIVSLDFELKLHDAEGETIERTEPGVPLVFLFGAGQLIPKFEDSIKGLKSGDEFEFVLQKDDAYGDYRQDLIVDIPLENFANEDGKIQEDILFEGNVVPMVDHEGNYMEGEILSVEGATAQVDFNPPLAGHDLYFRGKVLETREATEEELKCGHPHNNGCKDKN